MAFWNRKTNITPEPKPITPPPKVCNHAWKDFPWYIIGQYTKYAYTTHYEYNIYEPYVCIYCGERKDVRLEHLERDNISIQEADELLNDAHETYKDYIKPRAIIEDMINDFKLVDPQTLYYYEMLHKQAPEGGTEFSTPSSLRKSTPAKQFELKPPITLPQ